jgi:hypothetical protein
VDPDADFSSREAGSLRGPGSLRSLCSLRRVVGGASNLSAGRAAEWLVMHT